MYFGLELCCVSNCFYQWCVSNINKRFLQKYFNFVIDYEQHVCKCLWGKIIVQNSSSRFTCHLSFSEALGLPEGNITCKSVSHLIATGLWRPKNLVWSRKSPSWLPFLCWIVLGLYVSKNICLEALLVLTENVF